MRKIILTIFLTGFFLSCNDRLEELNKPTKTATTVPAETLFSNGLRELYDMMVNSDINVNVFRMYAQYWAACQYPDESNYNMVGRRIPDNFWERGYRDALKDLDESRRVLEETWEATGLTEAERDNRLAIININKAYVFAVLVDTFGAVPFTEALSLDYLSPKYDAGADIYDAVISMVENAISSLDEDAEGWPAAQDLVYEGDVASWIRFANTLKLKLAITISDVDATRAGTMISQALAGGVFESNDDNAAFPYLPTQPNTNPVWDDLVLSGRKDYVPANTIVDKLLDLNDPRLPVFATTKGDGTYEGGIYGTNNTYALLSHLGDKFHTPDQEGLILDYAEVQFMLAEAAERGFTTPATAAEHYTEGVTASLEYWGIGDAEITAYLANPDVAYATAEGGGTWKQKIGIQQWIAFFNRGFEGWSLWRRLDFDVLNVPPGLTYDDIPRRLIFPIEEATLNPVNLDNAIQMIGGSDDVQTKIFWDVNQYVTASLLRVKEAIAVVSGWPLLFTSPDNVRQNCENVILASYRVE